MKYASKLLFSRASLIAIACALCVSVASVIIAQGRGPGGPGGPNAPDLLLVEKYDADNDGVLNKGERDKARKELTAAGGRRGPGGRGGRGPGGRGPGGRGQAGGQTAGRPGPKVNSDKVKKYSSEGLYDPSVLRTIFIEFENDDWEEEMAVFKPTDVEIPAKVTVDGKTYENVGLSYRGASSFFMIPEGLKRSLNLSMNFMVKGQRLYGYKSLNLLNCNGDASMMSSALYSAIAREKIAAPKVNFVKVVINGRSWGVYANAQQFNKDFLKENFQTKKGNRWKVSGSPQGDAGLRYLGESEAPYRERFEIKSKDKPEAWQDLIRLCKVLNETPIDKLDSALKPLLDLDGVLWFLAADVALVNSDGYWTRASDYSIYEDPDGKFHILPHDMNEALREGHGGPGGPGGPAGGRGRGGPPRGGFGFGPFGFPGPPPGQGPPEGPGGQGLPNGPSPQPAAGRGGPPNGAGQQQPGGPQGRGGQRGRRGQSGPGGGGGPSHGGVELDPLVGIDSDRFPLRSKLLKNPRLQKQYLENVRTIALRLKNWNDGPESLGGQVAMFRKLIEKEVAKDTRKLTTIKEFKTATSTRKKPETGSLQAFAAKRAEFLLNHEKIKSLDGDDSK